MMRNREHSLLGLYDGVNSPPVTLFEKLRMTSANHWALVSHGFEII